MKYETIQNGINSLEALQTQGYITEYGIKNLRELKELIQIAEKYETIQASRDQSKLLLADVINPLLTDKQIEEYIWEEISIPLNQVDIDTHSDGYTQYLNAVHWAKFGRDNCNA